MSSLAARVAEHRARPPAAPSLTVVSPAASAPPAEPPPPPEPAWIQALTPAGRKRAHDLINRLEDAGMADAEELARCELVDHEPAIAALAVDRAIAALGPGATPRAVAGVLAEGEDAELEVKWRLVDGEGRGIELGSGRANGRSK